jgi:hypothetical protein
MADAFSRLARPHHRDPCSSDVLKNAEGRTPSRDTPAFFGLFMGKVPQILCTPRGPVNARFRCNRVRIKRFIGL